MSRKYDYISGLSDFTMKNATGSAENWTGFLRVAARLYRYSFEDQLLIYAQRPDATAVASIDVWNKRMNCWVNKGSKGIALIDKTRKGKLKYVFDVSNVHAAKHIGRLPNLWELKENQKMNVLTRLDEVYGVTDGTNTFEQRIIELSKNIADDAVFDIIPDLLDKKEDSLLDGLDELDIAVRLRETLSSSIAYTLLSRCGIDADSFMAELSFEHIREFSSLDTIGVLGDAVQGLCEPVLRDICRVIEDMDREEKISLANDSKYEYNALKRESETRNIIRGGNGYGDIIQMGRGLSGTEPGAGSGTGGRADEVRQSEKKISGGTPQRDIFGDASVREALDGFVQDSGTGRRESQEIDEAVYGAGRRDRGTESNRPDGVGAPDELDSQQSGRDGSDGDSLRHVKETEYTQLSLFPSEEDQRANIEAADTGMSHTESAVFSLSEKAPEETSGQNVQKSDKALAEGDIIIFPDSPDKWRVSRINDIQIDFENINENAETKSRSHIDFGADRGRLQEILKYEFVTDEIETNNEKSFAEQVDAALRGALPFYTSLRVCDTPQILLDVGCEQLPMLYTQKHLKNAILPKDEKEHRHGLEIEQIKRLPELLSSPIMVIDSPKRKDSIIVVTTEIDKDNNPIIASIKPNGNGRYEVENISSNFITSVYGRNNFPEYFMRIVQADNLLFCDKQKSQAMFERWGEQYSELTNNLDFGVILHQSRNIVNPFAGDDAGRDDVVPPTSGQNVQKSKKVSEPVKETAGNYHIKDESLGVGTPKEKFARNIEAIKTLLVLEKENRGATKNEQKILAEYVGWGGLADAFDESKSNWSKEYHELKSLLTPEEYESARESTLNAHFTSPAIIDGIYDTLSRMGFEKGNILEPAMGVGNFFGRLPEAMDKCRLYGVELDSLTGRIAKKLYPSADIRIKGFEETNFPGNFFDVAIGNVPFGQYKVSDRDYDKQNFLIHDYFFAKALDKVRPGGVVAFVTSKGTMDKKGEGVRRYLAERAELLGAVRLPNNAFKANAGTEVTSDIIFLKKRDHMAKEVPEWVYTSEDENGIRMNDYFVSHSEQIVGHMEMISGAHGMESACIADESRPFREQLAEALSNVEATIDAFVREVDSLDVSDDDGVIPADPEVRNFSYTIIDNEVYYRENSVMKPVDVPENKAERIKGLVGIRDTTRALIDMQMNEADDTDISAKMQELNNRYDDFEKKYGRINSRTNKSAFNQDASYSLLCSLEKFDSDGNFKEKADMFTKRTIKRAEVVTSVDTASEALAVSLSEKAKVDIPYMMELTGKEEQQIEDDLVGVIFKDPVSENWQTADEYLSGNVREKLAIAKDMAQEKPEYEINVKALSAVMPKDLEASEIEVRIGATWIKPEYVEQFMKETFQTPEYLTRSYGLSGGTVGVQYSDVTGLWNVKGKNADRANPLANSTYGTMRANAYKILEDSLNLKDSRVYDTVLEDGREKRVLNKKETMLASQKQEAVREAFKNWIFAQPERRADLVGTYNKLFNSIRPREYEGAHLNFPGMSPEVTLRPHQKNAVAHQLYGDNTLLAHCVGAGKTWEMAAAAMESKRLGLCRKSLFVVPNHLTEQWGSDFLQLYPGANILVATKKDFEPANRKRFCARIATGEYDAVIIGHTQFEKIPLSKERQAQTIQDQIDSIEEAIAQTKAERGERYTIKEMEKTRKALKVRLEKLMDSSKKDSVVTFEQLGVDRLFVDESHSYKNLFLYTKMRNVAGIAQTDAQKSSDMFAKCRYMDEITGGKGVTFATGTPISNSMTELYTNMRYLQYGTLEKLGLTQFDAWASSFGETQTAIELAPEGTGYRAKTRFAKFFNLPELISLFKESADIKTPDMLNLDVPEAVYENVVLKPSEFQKDMVASLADRAEVVRNGGVDSTVDNMLKITNDGRKLALDQRLINPVLPDDENSKASVCVEKAFAIYEEEKEMKGAQLIFCDLSTPKNDGNFNVYDDIKQKLMSKGVPENEIAFIHDANTETKKADLFAKVRSGDVRFLLGSTAKMGAGTNVQDRLIALHHLDVPWRPSDIEQQEGRIIRQGNMYKDIGKPVKIFRYVTEGTFDSYSWQVIENKQKFIGQIMTSKAPVRSCEDVDEAALTYAEVKALCTGNPYIKEKMDLDIQVSKLKLLKANHTSQRYRLEDNITKTYPKQIAVLTEKISGYKADIELFKNRKEELAARMEPVIADSGKEKEPFEIRVGNRVYTDRKEAGTALIDMCRNIRSISTPVKVGEYMGFQLSATFEPFQKVFDLNIRGAISHHIDIGADAVGNMTRIANALAGMETKLAKTEDQLKAVQSQLESAKAEVGKPFEKEQELAEKLDRLSELNALLNMDESGETERSETQEQAQCEHESSDAVVKKQDTSGHFVQKSEPLSLHDLIDRKRAQAAARIRESEVKNNPDRTL